MCMLDVSCAFVCNKFVALLLLCFAEDLVTGLSW